MNGVELYLLGQKLMRIGGNALLEDSGLRRLSPSAWLILADVVQYRDTSVPEIASRTGLQQDHVSASVSRMADDGLLETGVAPSGQQSVTVHHALRLEEQSASADGALAVALDTQDAGQVGELTATLESLARRLSTARSPRRVKKHHATSGGTPSWDIGGPQPAFAELAKAGAIRGRVLDVGCGTGEHALMATGLGLPALGVDVSSAAIELARRKAGERKLPARFAVHDALDLGALAEQFDTVLDSCLFHTLSDEDRARYEGSLREVIPPGGRYFMLCLSDRESPGPMPRRVTQEEIKSTFAEGWRVDEIEPVTLGVTVRPNGAPGWRAAVTRV